MQALATQRTGGAVPEIAGCGSATIPMGMFSCFNGKRPAERDVHSAPPVLDGNSRRQASAGGGVPDGASTAAPLHRTHATQRLSADS